MVKFAQACMRHLNELVHCSDLLEKLGHDTNQLAMRFGIHSGPITAGVLRGEKSRFQIFGDVSDQMFLLSRCQRVESS